MRVGGVNVSFIGAIVDRAGETAYFLTVCT